MSKNTAVSFARVNRKPDTNEVLRIKFRKLHENIVQLNLSPVIDRLFADGTIDASELRQLESCPPDRQTRMLLVILHNSKNPQVFSGFYKALKKQPSMHDELVERLESLDEDGNEKYSPVPQPIPVDIGPSGGKLVSVTAGGLPSIPPKLNTSNVSHVQSSSGGDDTGIVRELQTESSHSSLYDDIQGPIGLQDNSSNQNANEVESEPTNNYESLLTTARPGEPDSTVYNTLDSSSPIAVLPDGRVVRGVVFLCKKLFVVRRLSPDVEVYSTSSWKHLTTFQVTELTNPTDIAASRRLRCLYVIVPAKLNSTVNSIRTGGRSILSISTWTVGDSATSLSLSESSGGGPTTILVTCQDSRSLRQFTDDGQLLRRVALHRDLANPSHAVILPSGNVAVSCYGENCTNPCPRVCVVNGFVSHTPPIADCGASNPDTSGLFASPRHMAVDDEGTFLYVADQERSRVVKVKLDSMEVVEEIQTDSGNLNFEPTRVSISASGNQLCVACNRYVDGRLYTTGHVAIYAPNCSTRTTPKNKPACRVS